MFTDYLNKKIMVMNSLPEVDKPENSPQGKGLGNQKNDTFSLHPLIYNNEHVINNENPSIRVCVPVTEALTVRRCCLHTL